MVFTIGVSVVRDGICLGPWPLSMGRILGYWGRDGSGRCRFYQIAPVSSFPDLVEINNKNDTSKGNKPIKRVFPMFSQEIRRKQDFIGGDAEVI